MDEQEVFSVNNTFVIEKKSILPSVLAMVSKTE
jgi:hypothetical protein